MLSRFACCPSFANPKSVTLQIPGSHLTGANALDAKLTAAQKQKFVVGFTIEKSDYITVERIRGDWAFISLIHTSFSTVRDNVLKGGGTYGAISILNGVRCHNIAAI